MDTECRGRTPSRTRCCLVLLAGVALFLPRAAVAQGPTGSLIGTVRDEQGGVLSGAIVRVGSPALIGGPATQTTNQKGQLRFAALPPGNTCSRSRLRDSRPIAKRTSASAQAPRSKE